VAEVLWGITNPSGKLPYTYHAVRALPSLLQFLFLFLGFSVNDTSPSRWCGSQRTGDIRVPYYHSYSDPGTPLYPFGFGLSFSSTQHGLTRT
jgi:hypothetical protein